MIYKLIRIFHESGKTNLNLLCIMYELIQIWINLNIMGLCPSYLDWIDLQQKVRLQKKSMRSMKGFRMSVIFRQFLRLKKILYVFLISCKIL